MISAEVLPTEDVQNSTEESIRTDDTQTENARKENEEEELKETIEQEEVMMEKKKPKGPIIICVDTSGSMHGTPENIAKTVAFALAKIAAETGGISGVCKSKYYLSV